jgi:uncharacterized protein
MVSHGFKGMKRVAAAVLTLLVVVAAPLLLVACLDQESEKKEEPKTADVTISGKTFKLELALNDQTRFRGLSGRTELPADEGMLFVFQRSEPRAFVMRDCPIPIDIIYLDGAGRIVAFHKMVPEPPRSEEEKKLKPSYPGAPEWMSTNEDYEKRLKTYPSGFATQFVIELKGDTLDTLKVKKGDQVKLDTMGLKKLAK